MDSFPVDVHPLRRDLAWCGLYQASGPLRDSRNFPTGRCDHPCLALHTATPIRAAGASLPNWHTHAHLPVTTRSPVCYPNLPETCHSSSPAGNSVLLADGSEWHPEIS